MSKLVSGDSEIVSENKSKNKDKNKARKIKQKGKITCDLEAVLTKDPAANTKFDVIVSSPGFHALVMYRWFHHLHNRNFKKTARLLSTFTRCLTGVDIHPGAKIGKGVMIDHGSGVVIGETCEIGDGVVIYQGVTLGGTGKDIGKRHPTIGNNVMISAGAKVLGPFKVGDNSKIGANSVVLKEVPPNSTVVGIPGRVIDKNPKKDIAEINQTKLDDPIMEQINAMKKRIEELEARLNNENL